MTADISLIPSRGSYYQKIGSALFYGVVSLLITVVNKSVLTTWKFPSYWTLSVGQIVATIILLRTAKQLKLITFPDYSSCIGNKIFPLPLIHFGNMVFGLASTKFIPLPTFTAVRRFAIWLTMLMEQIFLKVHPSLVIQSSVYSMIFGAMIAAWDDLTFTVQGYTFVSITNVLSAANGVCIKWKLGTIDLGCYGIMYYNSLIVLMPTIIGALIAGDFASAYDFPDWKNYLFVSQFIMSCIMGFLLTYSSILCTHYNSALTVTIIGCIKNVFVSYIGIIVGGDYIFSWLNMLGINISTVGSLVYAYIVFKKPTDTST